ncbi:hypothetical protein Q9L58_010440 [Maublancomyces gigas]|uniref:Endonuclease/exonuclease/phosphatase domain-containing protein n=1 Tax=Discina gigas TaxID=1032678 RepID=A0ABR3G453_9PEZI
MSDNSGILSIVVESNGTWIEIINSNAPSGRDAAKYLASHKSHRNTIMASDFNSHHAMWYADKASDYVNSIRNSKTVATSLVTWATKHILILQNDPATLTHFAHSSQHQSILDVTFSSGYSTTITEAWSCDPGSGGNSNHAMTIPSINIFLPS